MIYIKFTLYAPVDCEILKLEELNDGVFSEKIIGDGFVVEPKNGDFYSIIENGIIKQIFETKHAIFFEQDNGPSILMHIGMDTVKLNGKPFKHLKNENKKVSLKDKIVEVDLQMIDKEKLSFKTPIILIDEEEKYKISNIKYGSFKKGEPICYVEEVEINKKIKENLEILNFIDQYSQVAKDIYENIGTTANIETYYNCFTRFRIIVKNKDLLNTEKLKKINLVRGLHWNGMELQIIIGNEVAKVYEAFKKMETEIRNETGINGEKVKKTSIKDKLLAFVTGVMAPCIPVVVAAGLLVSLKSILEQVGLIQVVSLKYTQDKWNILSNYDLFTGFIYIISQMGLSFIGVLFCIQTVKYFGGNILAGAFIGLSIATPFLFSGQSWVLFNLFGVAIKFQAFTSSVLPQIGGALIFIYTSRWIKTWMPSIVDLMFTMALSYLITLTAIFFLIGPLLGLIEVAIYNFITLVGKIPYGFGAAIFFFFWQMLVLTGTHIAILNMINISIANSQPTIMGLFTISVFAQIGSAWGVFLRTKNSKLKTTIIAATPAAILGVSEPLLYSVNLPKGKPFINGCIGAAIGAIVMTLFNLEALAPGGGGLFALTRVIDGGPMKILFLLLSFIIVTFITMIITFFNYNERPDELKESKKLLYKIIKNNKELEPEVIFFLEKIKTNLIPLTTEGEKNLIKYTKLSNKVNIMENKNNKQIEKLKLKSSKLVKSGKFETIEKLNIKFLELRDNTKIIALIHEKEILENWKNNFLLELEKVQENLNSIFIDNIEKNKIKNENYMKAKFFNVIHSLDINYELTKKII